MTPDVMTPEFMTPYTVIFFKLPGYKYRLNLTPELVTPYIVLLYSPGSWVGL
jgi:hypothetical protein